MKLLLMTFAAVTAFAQTKSLACDGSNRESACEMREQTLAYGGRLTVDGGNNGGASVKGWDNSSVLVRARVETHGVDASQVHVEWTGNVVRASGPQSANNQWWSVSFEVFVPRSADLTVKTHNGGIAIADVRGNIEFDAVNGGVHLKNLGGDVEGRTKNGGLNIELSGNRWDGARLDARTTNGGINVSMPQAYSAHLETATVNGHINTDMEMTVHGSIGKNLTADVGSGGPTIHVETTNGGVNFKKM
jgi:hypothetical protein